MNERAAFIRNIIDQPDDDTVRLVFADWLDENGEPRWATFIRSHVANPEPRRASSLPMPLSKTIFAAECWSGLPASQITLTRGFPSAVECTAGYWLEWGDAIRAAHPVTRVRLTTLPSGISPLANLDWAITERNGRLCKFAKWPGVEFDLPDVVRVLIEQGVDYPPPVTSPG